MSGLSQQQEAVLDELTEWWEDLSRRGIGSRAVLVPVPSRWGRTTLLGEFTAVVERDACVSLVVKIDGASQPDGLGLQAQALRSRFVEAGLRQRRAASVLGADRPDWIIRLGLGVGGLFVSPLPAGAAFLLASLAAEAAGRVWDDTVAGQDGGLARLARAVAAVSVSLPVVVVIDDADSLETALAVTLAENLVERHDGQVLVVAAADPGGELIPALTSRAAYGLTAGRFVRAEAEPGMDYRAGPAWRPSCVRACQASLPAGSAAARGRSRRCSRSRRRIAWVSWTAARMTLPCWPSRMR